MEPNRFDGLPLVGPFNQPSSEELTDIVALSPANDDVLQRKAGAWTNRTMAQLAADVPVASLSGTKANFDAACSDGNFAYQSDLAGYQPLDTQLTDLAALSYAGNALKVVRVNAGATAFELATPTSGSATITQIEQNLGATPAYRGTFTVVDAAVSASSKIIIFQASGPYTNKGTRADESDMDALRVTATPASGQFTVRWEVLGHIAFQPIEREGQRRAGAATAFNAADPPRLAMQTERVGRVKGNFKFNYMVG